MTSTSIDLADDYQQEALVTWTRNPMPEYPLAYPATKLAGEAGEVADKIGKLYRDSDGVLSPEAREALKLELGDVLWYVAILASELGYELSEIMVGNIVKLRDRQGRGVLAGSGDNR